jgi:hypothetical protein
VALFLLGPKKELREVFFFYFNPRIFILSRTMLKTVSFYSLQVWVELARRKDTHHKSVQGVLKRTRPRRAWSLHWIRTR